MRKGDGESCNADLRPGAGGFHCGDFGGQNTSRVHWKERRCQNRSMNPLKASRKVQKANLNTTSFCLIPTLNKYLSRKSSNAYMLLL